MEEVKSDKKVKWSKSDDGDSLDKVEQWTEQLRE